MQNIKLNLVPGSVMPVVNVSQYDKARQFSISVYEGSAAYSLTGKDVQIRGTKPDGNGFAYDSTDGVVSVSGSTVTISTTQQMTAVGGQTMAELRITSGDTILGTLNFVLMVELSALSDDTPISETDIPAIERDFEAALAEAEADALKAEGYAVGTQDGTPAQSGEPYYQDNAKYYKEQAEAAASGGGADALKAEGYAAGTQNGVPVTSGSPYYHNNAAYYEGEASTSATNAATSETNAGLSETAAGNSATSAAADALKSEGWANGKQNGTPVGPGSPYYQDNAKYYKEQAAQYAAGGLIFKGSVAFASIPTTGMVNGDMYNITDDFTTDSRFIEGAGLSVKAGADIAYVAGSVNKWDILALGGGGGGADALDDLTDVDITTPADGDLLQYNATSQKWENSQAVPNNIAAIENVYGSKNLLKNTATTQVVSGVTFTINNDGSFTASTETETADVVTFVMNLHFSAPAGTYSMSLNSPNTSEGRMRFWTHGGGIAWDSSWGWVYTFNGGINDVKVEFRLSAGFSGTKTFYPMIRDARIVDDTYVPYAMTNRELTDNKLNIAWEAVSGVTANTDYCSIVNGFCHRLGKLVKISYWINVTTALPAAGSATLLNGTPRSALNGGKFIAYKTNGYGVPTGDFALVNVSQDANSIVVLDLAHNQALTTGYWLLLNEYETNA